MNDKHKLCLIVPPHVVGEESNVIPLPQGAVARLEMGGITDVKHFPDGNYLAYAIGPLYGQEVEGKSLNLDIGTGSKCAMSRCVCPKLQDWRIEVI